MKLSQETKTKLSEAARRNWASGIYNNRKRKLSFALVFETRLAPALGALGFEHVSSISLSKGKGGGRTYIRPDFTHSERKIAILFCNKSKKSKERQAKLNSVLTRLDYQLIRIDRKEATYSPDKTLERIYEILQRN